MMLDRARDAAKEIAGDLLTNKDIEDLPIEVGYEGEDSPAASINNIDGDETLILNLDVISEDKEEKILSAASTQVWQEQGGIFDFKINEDVNLVKDALTREDIQSIVKYFSKYLPDEEVELLQRCLYLRLEWEDDSTYTDSRQMTDRKSDLRRKYGNKASVVANLSSSGYYDENGYMREVFKKIERAPTLGPTDYQQIYNQMLQDEPFCVFISGKHRVHNIKELILSKINAYDKYPISLDFVDARGQGGENRAKLEQAILELQREADAMHFEVWVQPRETSYRIHPEHMNTGSS